MTEQQIDPNKEYKERYEAQKQRGVKFFPDIIYKDMIVAFGMFVILVILAAFIGVKPEPPADPNDASYIPRPEWYFLFLFQMLKYFPGSIEWVGTTVVPVVAILALLLLPFYDRSPVRHWRRCRHPRGERGGGGACEPGTPTPERATDSGDRAGLPVEAASYGAI